MDEIDNKIIAELRRDARMSYSALAATTGLSRVTVRARVERLVSSGAILGFTLILKEDMRHSPIRGHTLLAIEGAGTDRIKRILAGMPAVQAISGACRSCNTAGFRSWSANWIWRARRK